MRRFAFVSTLLVAGVVRAQLPGDPYTAIPKGFDFPADQAKLLAARDAGDLAAMRRHGWSIFAGLTQPAKSGGPLFETWFRGDEVMAWPKPQSVRGPRTLQRKFEPPRQHRREGIRGAHAQAAGQALFSFVLFDREVRTHVAQHKLYDAGELVRLHDDFVTKKAPPADRKIADFPVAAVALKLIWWPVAKNARTPLPVWDYDPVNRPDPFHRNGAFDANTTNDMITWKRIVVIDSTGAEPKPGEVVDAGYRGEKFRARVVPVRRFYAVTLSAADVSAANDVMPGAARGVLGRDLAAGDQLVLIAMHCTTKEIPDWTWSTYFWHDRPDAGPKAADRVPSVKGVWRNYLMDVSFDHTLPRENDGSPHIAYNPVLEARFSNGLLSNCLTCHRRSVWPQEEFLPITRGDNAVDKQLFPPEGKDPAFADDKLRLDFLWSIGDLAQPPPAK